MTTELNVAKLFESNKIKNIHFIGIGGISMSGLAEILLDIGYNISGSDSSKSSTVLSLESKGIKVYFGHNEQNIADPDLVVYTAAIKDSNPELLRARSLGIPTIDRATLLGYIMRRYPVNISVSGCHGKTTTSSMISTILYMAGADPTVHIGGGLDIIGGSTRIGKGNCFVVEACEYVESFLKFSPYIAVLLNIDFDHVDYFRDIEHIKETFKKFVSLVPSEGAVVVNVDDPNVLAVCQNVACRKVTYGIQNQSAAWRAENIEINDAGCPSFTIINEGKDLGTVALNVPGMHNVYNALAAIASCSLVGLDIKDIISGLAAFSGAHRRFQTKGVINGTKVVDDYAHHPTEVRATLKAARKGSYKKIWCVFQPHTYSRTKSLLSEFNKAFDDADVLILADIYAAREVNPGDINSGILAENIRTSGKEVHYISSFEDIAKFLRTHISEGDLVITMGAGDVFKVGEMLLEV